MNLLHAVLKDNGNIEVINDVLSSSFDECSEELEKIC